MVNKIARSAKKFRAKREKKNLALVFGYLPPQNLICPLSHREFQHDFKTVSFTGGKMQKHVDDLKIFWGFSRIKKIIKKSYPKFFSFTFRRG